MMGVHYLEINLKPALCRHVYAVLKLRLRNVDALEATGRDFRWLKILIPRHRTKLEKIAAVLLASVFVEKRKALPMGLPVSMAASIEYGKTLPIQALVMYLLLAPNSHAR
jgi:hypothetical protein